MSGHPKTCNAFDPQNTAKMYTFTAPWRRVRRAVFALASIILSAAGIFTMAKILWIEGLTLLDVSMLILFAATFSWIVIAFLNGLMGFIIQALNRDPIDLRRISERQITTPIPDTKVAVIMPVYNEQTSRIIAGFESNAREIFDAGMAENFQFYMLSDTTDLDIANTEQLAWSDLMARLPQELKEKCFYRRRQHNTGRKVGNITDFCERWGSYYEYMIILDADSLMTAKCASELVNYIHYNPTAGLIQTVPIPVRQKTFFGRYLQFAAAFNSPMLANGLAFWQTDGANYWGHNAIIRVHAFMNSCGMPAIAGGGPLSGEILSHDFVEAALLRRAGWGCYLVPNVGGSYEEVPADMVEFATRDRRWVQGNLQHLALLKSRSFHRVSRLHFIFGAVAYLTTLLWLLMLTLSTVDAIWRELVVPPFFTSQYQLFPSWPVDNSTMIYSMFYVTIGLLIMPKIFAAILVVTKRPNDFGGAFKAINSAMAEFAFSVLIAPIMMVYHSYFVISVFLGRKVGWKTANREGRALSWKESSLRAVLPTALGIIWTSIGLYFAPQFILWMSPVLVGLLLSAPIIRISSAIGPGLWIKEHGIFTAPSEINIEPVIDTIDYLGSQQSHAQNDADYHACESTHLLPEKWRTMPVQNIE